MDHSPPVSSVHGILQTRIQEWVAIPFSTEEVYFIKVNLVTKCRAACLCHQLNDFGGGLVAKSCQTLATPWTIARPLCLWVLQDTRVGCHFLLQGIFLTQESNPDLLNCRQILYQLICDFGQLVKWSCLPFRVGFRNREGSVRVFRDVLTSCALNTCHVLMKHHCRGKPYTMLFPTF